jgi:phosphotransferase system IIA component
LEEGEWIGLVDDVIRSTEGPTTLAVKIATTTYHSISDAVTGTEIMMHMQIDDIRSWAQ